MRSRLLTRYTLFIFGLILIVGTVLSTVFIIRFSSSTNRLIASASDGLYEEIISLTKERGHTMATFLAQNLATPLYNYDERTIMEMLTPVRKSPAIGYVYVFDSNGRVIHDGRADVPNMTKEFTDEIGINAVKSDELITQYGDNVLDIAIPILHTDGTRLGGVRLGLKLKNLKIRIQNIQFQLNSARVGQIQTNFFIILIVLILLFPLGYWVAMRMTADLSGSLSTLTQLTGSVASGNLDVHVDIDRSDELGDLAKSFERMVQSLKDTTVSRQYVDEVIDQVIDILVLVSPEGKIQRVNRATCDILEYRDTDLVGHSFGMVFGDLTFRNEWLKKIQEKGRIDKMDTRFLTKDKRGVPVHFSASLLRNTNGEPTSIICVAQDITEIKKNKKFSSIGQLASVVAHELRNPLGAIKNSIYYFKEVLKGTKILEEDPSLRDFLDLSDKEIKRSNRIVGELLDFARDVKLTLYPTDINSLIDEVAETVDIPKDVQWVRPSVNGGLPLAMVDPQKLRQVFINLTTNALVAMPHGGTLEVAARIKNAGDSEHKFIEITFRDTGIGISQEKIKHIFEPLYTTRQSGTGLGLAICQEIIQVHGGKFEVVSQEGKGTTFTIIFPLVLPQA